MSGIRGHNPYPIVLIMVGIAVAIMWERFDIWQIALILLGIAILVWLIDTLISRRNSDK